MKPTKPPTKPKVLLSVLKNQTKPKIASVNLKLEINRATFAAQKSNLTAQLAHVAGVDPSRVEVAIVPARKSIEPTESAPKGGLLAVQIGGDGAGDIAAAPTEADSVTVSVRILPAVSATQEAADTAIEKLAGQPPSLLSTELGAIVAGVTVQDVPTISPSVLAKLAATAAPNKNSGVSTVTVCTSLALLALALPLVH